MMDMNTVEIVVAIPTKAVATVTVFCLKARAVRYWPVLDQSGACFGAVYSAIGV